MDEKGVPENPTEPECHTEGDGDGADNSDTKEAETGSSTDIKETCRNPESEVKDVECDLKTVCDTEKTSELPNHVDYNSSINSGVVQESESYVKSDSKESLKCDEVSSTPDKVSKEASDNSTHERLKNVDITEESPKKDGDEFIQESNSEGISQSDNKDSVEEVADNDDREEKKDEVGKPEFETAPNVSIDEPQEDHTQALDPFDALLRDRSDSTTETAETATQATVNVVDEDDDHDVYNADDHGEEHADDHTDDHVGDDLVDDLTQDDDDEHHPEDASLDDSVVSGLGEEPGADEEVCLLPDTEREISEADKAEAEKALAEKRKQAEAAASAILEGTEPKKENEFAGEEERRSSTEEPTQNDEECDAGDHPAGEGETDDAAHENGDKENEHDDSAEAEASFVSNTIQEISPCTATCVQCKTETSCSYRFATKDITENYVCGESCLKGFIANHPNQYTVAYKKYLVEEIVPKLMTCSECEEKKVCYFYYNFDGEDTNYCSIECLHSMMADERDKYVFRRRRIIVEEKPRKDAECLVCKETKKCMYTMMRYGKLYSICEHSCIKTLNDAENGRYTVRKRRTPRNQTQTNTTQANNPPLLKLKVISNATDKYLDEAYKIKAKTPAMIQAAREERERTFVRHCSQCNSVLTSEDKMLMWETMDFCNEVCLGRYQNQIGSRCANCSNAVQHTSLGKYCVRFGYDIRQFCNSGCLEEFKKGLKICCYCQRDISMGHQGFLAPVGDKGQFKDFCSQTCMEKFDQMSKNPVPKPVWAKCAVCSLQKGTPIEVEVSEEVTQRLCSDPCFAAFKFVNNIFPDQCRWCKKYFERKASKFFTIYENSNPQCFCSKPCMNVYISNSRHIVPCNWCKVKKYNFDMIKRVQANGQMVLMCSLNCLNLYQVSVNAVSSRRTKCDRCKRTSLAQYHLTMSDATVRNFCTYQCVMSFQGQYSKHAAPMVTGESVEPKAVPTGAPRRTYTSENKNNAIKTPKTNAEICKEYRKRKKDKMKKVPEVSVKKKNNAKKCQEYRLRKKMRALGYQSFANQELHSGVDGTPDSPTTFGPPPLLVTTASKGQQRASGLPIISKVQSLAPPPLAPSVTRGKSKRLAAQAEPEPPQAARSPPPPPRPPTPPPPPPPKVYNHVIVKTLPPHEVANKATIARPMTASKGVSCRPHPCTKECQTDPSLERRVLIPIPVPIYVPVPCAMWSLPFPVPVPIPLPIPTPVFIPTTRNSAKGIMKEINKIHDKMPTDPFEAELLMMAEMVAGDKKKDQSDSDTEDENEESFSPVGGMDGNNFGEDMLQMALKMATEYEDQPVDLESAMTANTITPSSHPGMPGLEGEGMHAHQMMLLEQQRAVAALRAAAPRKRAPAAAPDAPPARPARSKRRRAEPAPPPPEPPREPQEKPDANMCLKYTFGVNAWKQWVMTKNAEIEKSSVRRKPFKSEILQLTADELNYSLCLFVKEVRKPNGSEYAPDTIYYLVLGIQQYLFENGRIDNIFTDPYYEKFTDCLDEVARKFSVLYNDSQYIVTRVEEEHLWESKQLGAHSPHVLLSTLMFFNTKHFNLVTVEEHMQLSFSHIMKHWKRNPNQPGQAKMPGSRNVLLRFYPPQSALEANSRKKKVYEQQENEENPLRCPVKLYEFYISKCPESVRTRNDVFYLQPERSCVPDSPVWYSTQPLSRAALAKMLHRVKMVKEINIALLTS